MLTGFGPEAARDAAAATLPWLIAAALGQFAAGLLASALAAMDDYVTPAIGYIGGSLAGLALILARIDENGVDAVAWGMALNAAIATLVSTLALARRARARADAAPRRSGRGGAACAGALRELLAGAALPFALQAIYLICLPIAARGGVGDRDELRLRVPHRRPPSSPSPPRRSAS